MTVQMKLMAGFLAVVAIFALSGVYGISEIRQNSARSERFLKENWPTIDLIMEARIDLGEAGKAILSPPADQPPADIIASARDLLSGLKSDFAAASLSGEEVRSVLEALEGLERTLAPPVDLASVPGRKMEAADAAAAPVLKAAEEVGDPHLVDILWQGIMAFNDVLITGDPEEETAFRERMAEVRNHPQFPLLSEPFVPFESAGGAVFAAAEDLQEARAAFAGAHQVVNDTLAEL